MVINVKCGDSPASQSFHHIPLLVCVSGVKRPGWFWVVEANGGDAINSICVEFRYRWAAHTRLVLGDMSYMRDVYARSIHATLKCKFKRKCYVILAVSSRRACGGRQTFAASHRLSAVGVLGPTRSNYKGAQLRALRARTNSSLTASETAGNNTGASRLTNTGASRLTKGALPRTDSSPTTSETFGLWPNVQNVRPSAELKPACGWQKHGRFVSD